MTEAEVDKAAIERFVREQLGCACPADVFSSINLVKNPPEFSDLMKGNLLAIGGRLLIYLLETDDLLLIVPKLEQLFRRGHEIRNAGGFNRFRLVVAAPVEQPAQEVLMREFDSLSGLDEKLHLHVIRTEQLPKL